MHNMGMDPGIHIALRRDTFVPLDGDGNLIIVGNGLAMRKPGTDAVCYLS